MWTPGALAPRPRRRGRGPGSSSSDHCSTLQGVRGSGWSMAPSQSSCLRAGQALVLLPRSFWFAPVGRAGFWKFFLSHLAVHFSPWRDGGEPPARAQGQVGQGHSPGAPALFPWGCQGKGEPGLREGPVFSCSRVWFCFLFLSSLSHLASGCPCLMDSVLAELLGAPVCTAFTAFPLHPLRPLPPEHLEIP